ncbi:carbohydrate-binding protein [Gelidibacter salicanalis]|uniref:Carbohydrate-binding protein n=1 Tax=Gelidibacter salicanalis TaxID=291193 RepID=A0A5C7AI29_9FLAO|nr:malectin domain-containing carbohydrate-binding protein [Gelidibacter salicanalis]TXE07509.1 carbohydrate-binding protein [Gelidibacter salicanalis]
MKITLLPMMKRSEILIFNFSLIIKNSFLNLPIPKSLKTGLSSFVFSILLIGVTHAQLPKDKENKFQQVDLLTGLRNSTTMKFAPDGRIFILDRYGEILIYNTESQSSITAGSIRVFHELEDGLLGIAFDPNFLSNNFIYITYSPIDFNVNRVSRFKMDGDDLNLQSEIVLLEWPTSRTAKFHSGGGMDFDSKGNLYIATGDNTGYDNFYAAWNEKNADYSAEKSSSNTNDLRGKILRIKPQLNGTYTIPTGNLFPEETPFYRPEIYVMGARNPYRIFVDRTNTDWLFWGDVGPDADASSVLGPTGLDEINLTKKAGNYGWPYFIGVDNGAYQIPYKTPKPFYNVTESPENTSKWNTGATNLPPAQPAWIEYDHASFFSGPRYYYDHSLSNQQRLPIEFDEAYFYYDFNTSKIWAVKMDAQGKIIPNSKQRFAPGVFPGSSKEFNGYIDMAIGPDGKMYILAYGTGCCPQNVGTGRLIRVDYTGITTNAPPNVKIAADIDNGSLPLTVKFSSDGTTDPNGDSPLSYEWDVNEDGKVDYTVANPTHTYTATGTYKVKLIVRDGKGGVGVNNITINAGNNAAQFNFVYPPDGGLMNWQDDVEIKLTVTDIEDGSIDCDKVNIVPSLGHLNHFHDDNTLTGCPTTVTLDADNTHGADGEQDIFYVLNANYKDTNGLLAFDQIQLHPKRKEAEFFDIQEGTSIIPNSDPLEGGSKAIQVKNKSYISYSGRNLFNITAVKYKVAATLGGGIIELRLGSITGPLIATTSVPSTGSKDSWVAIESKISDPGGKNDLFFVFRHPSQTDNIFHLNYVEFMGAGVSIDNSPPLVGDVTPIGNSQIKVIFTEYVTKVTAEQISNYVLNHGVSITSAILQPDGRTVMLAVSPLTSDVIYNLQIRNVKNNSGKAVVTDSYAFSTISSIRINTGGPTVKVDSGLFEADNYVTGGKDGFQTTSPINGTYNDELYQTERYGKSFSYTIPLPIAGEYDIRLHFAELHFGIGNRPGGSGKRVFNVSIEGVQVLTDFDILDETKPLTALIKEFNNISVTDGFANIQFQGVTENAKVSAIEILSPDTFNLEPKITIVSPQTGWNVDENFQISFSVENWSISKEGTHMHYFINDDMFPHYNYGPINVNNLNQGSHTIRLELYNDNHSPTGIYDEIMVAVTDQRICNTTIFPESWVVHQLEANPYTAVYTLPNYDLDGDGLKDIVTGGWWYKNPGSASGNWVKSTIGGGFGNVVHVYDFDGDGYQDLLGTQIGPSGKEYQSERLLWAKNDGKGNFKVFDNIPMVNSGYFEPFLAGIAGGNFRLGSPYQMAINWNGAETSTGSPVQLLTPSADPTKGTWTLEDISNDSSGEDIKAGDIDGDGDLDLFQGVNWLRNEGNGTWTTFSTGITYATTLDRVQLADFNGDGRMDGVVGQLGLGSKAGKSEFAWFESPENPTLPWIKHVLSTDIKGSLSVSAIDLDFDGDMDIVVGEWLGSKRLIAFENDLCNSGEWQMRILNDGSLNLEHHDGAMVTDIDNDGDLDVISNGWLKNKMPRIYENTSLATNNQEPLTDAGEDQTLSLPTNTIILSGSGSDPAGGAVSFIWTQVDGASTATLSGNDTSELSVNNLVVGDYKFKLTVTNDKGVQKSDEVNVKVLAAASAIRINSGGPDYIYNNLQWQKDQYFNGGSVLKKSIDIANTANDKLYQTERYHSTGNLVYNIPVQSGTYDLNLHFAEIYFGVAGEGSSGGVGSRVFNVNIENGQEQLLNYDIIVAAGGSATAVIEHFTGILVDDGNLTITFTAIQDFPKVSGIEILPSKGDSLKPIVDAGGDRQITLPTTTATLDGSAYDPDGGFINSYKWTQVNGPNEVTMINSNTDNLSVANLMEGSYTFRLTVIDDENDSASDDMVLKVSKTPVALRINSGGPDFEFNGEIWNADQYYLGGTVGQNPSAVIDKTENDQLYQTERFSSNKEGLIYEIPVSNGLHNLKLHFAEIYFAVSEPASAAGVGSRVFTIDIENGTHRIENYDIIIDAGGAATAVVKNFANILVTDGYLTVKLLPVKQFPKISGLEIIESRLPNVSAGADQTITLPTNTITQHGVGSDPDGGSVSYLWTQVSGPAAATLVGADTPDLVANNLTAGIYTFNLTVTDDENDIGSDQVTITVISDAANTPPKVTNPGTQNSAEGNAITLQITASDADGNNLNYGITGLPSGLTINTSTGVISGTIAAGISANSPYTVEVTVTDDGTPSASTKITFIWNVTTAAAENQAPVVTNPGTQNSAEGNAITLQITASDADGNNLSYGITGLPSGLTINTSTGVISGTIAAGASANSPYTVEVTVTDDGAPSKSTKITFSWIIGSAVINQAPIAVIVADKIVGDAPLKIFFSGSKSTDDKEIVSYMWDFKDGMTSDDMNPIHVFEQPGTYEVELTVSDGVLTNTATIIITIIDSKESIKVAIKPNPASVFAKLYLLNATSDNRVNSIRLHDAAGKFINSITNPLVVDGYYKIPILGLEEGIYYMTVHIEGSTKKVVGFVVKN